MMRKLLYHRGIDETVATYVTDYVIGSLFVFFGLFLIVMSIRSKSSRQRSYAGKVQDGGQRSNKQDGNLSEDIRGIGRNKIPSKDETESMSRFSSLKAVSISLYVTCGLMHILGGLTHHCVHKSRDVHLTVHASGNLATRSGYDKFVFASDTLKTRQSLLPWYVVWQFANTLGGLVAVSFLLLVPYTFACDVIDGKSLPLEGARSRSSSQMTQRSRASTTMSTSALFQPGKARNGKVCNFVSVASLKRAFHVLSFVIVSMTIAYHTYNICSYQADIRSNIEILDGSNDYNESNEYAIENINKRSIEDLLQTNDTNLAQFDEKLTRFLGSNMNKTEPFYKFAVNFKNVFQAKTTKNTKTDVVTSTSFASNVNIRSTSFTSNVNVRSTSFTSNLNVRSTSFASTDQPTTFTSDIPKKSKSLLSKIAPTSPDITDVITSVTGGEFDSFKPLDLENLWNMDDTTPLLGVSVFIYACFTASIVLSRLRDSDKDDDAMKHSNVLKCGITVEPCFTTVVVHGADETPDRCQQINDRANGADNNEKKSISCGSDYEPSGSSKISGFSLHTWLRLSEFKIWCLRCLGAWTVLCSGVVQFSLSMRCGGDDAHDTLGCPLADSFNHNSLYHVLLGVGMTTLFISDVMHDRFQKMYRVL